MFESKAKISLRRDASNFGGFYSKEKKYPILIRDEVCSRYLLERRHYRIGELHRQLMQASVCIYLYIYVRSRICLLWYFKTILRRRVYFLFINFTNITAFHIKLLNKSLTI